MASLTHTFNVQVAQKYKSTDLAILYHHFVFWISHNAQMGRNEIEGRTWCYQTIEELAAYFPYWSKKQVERLVAKAIKMKMLRKANYNVTKYDRTLWYSIEDEDFAGISRIREIEKLKSGNQNPEIGRPIPDSKADSEKDKSIGASAPAPLFKERAQEVKTSDKEHEELVARYGEEFVKACYQKLSDWKLDTPRAKWKKSDYRSILRWVVSAVQESNKGKSPAAPGGATPASVSVEDIEQNKALAQGAEQAFWDWSGKHESARVQRHANYIAIDMEIKGFSEKISFDRSPSQFRAALKAAMSIVGMKMN